MVTKFNSLPHKTGAYVEALADFMFKVFERSPAIAALPAYQEVSKDKQVLLEMLASDTAGLDKYFTCRDQKSQLVMRKNVSMMAGHLEELTRHLNEATPEQFAHFVRDHGVDPANPNEQKVKEFMHMMMAEPKKHHVHIERILENKPHPHHVAETPVAAAAAPAATAALAAAPVVTAPVAAVADKPAEDVSGALAEYEVSLRKMLKHLARTGALKVDSPMVAEAGGIDKFMDSYVAKRRAHLVEKNRTRFEIYALANKVGQAEDLLDGLEKGVNGVTKNEKLHFNMLDEGFKDVTAETFHPKLKAFITKVDALKQEMMKQEAAKAVAEGKTNLAQMPAPQNPAAALAAAGPRTPMAHAAAAQDAKSNPMGLSA